MSGQYPSVFSNAMGGIRGQFNPQQGQSQQPQHPHSPQIMNQLQMNSTSNSGASGTVGGMTPPGNMMNMSFSQAGMMSPHQQVSMQGMPTTVNVMSGGVMSTVGLQSVSHVQQQQQQQVHLQQHPQHQQQQQIHLQQQTQPPQLSLVSQSGLIPGAGNMSTPQQIVHSVNIGQASHNISQMPAGSANMGLMAQHQQQQQQQQHQAQNTPLAGGHQSQTISTVHHSQVTGMAAGSVLSSSQQATSNSMFSISQQPHKEINIVTLSRVGQETVQDITSRFQEIFAALKIIQPTANRDNNTVKKVQEHFRTIRLLFKRMRLIYERCHDAYPQGIEYTTAENLIPFKDEGDHHRHDLVQCEEYRKALQENQELIDTVKLKNRQLREIIDRTRIIVWEINTMLNMRRS